MIAIIGSRVYPGDGNAPSLYEIGWGLARTSRFQGQTRIWYPVLPHSYVVASLVPEEFKLEALLHDSAEAVLGDRVATWKDQYTQELEAEVLANIYNSLGLGLLNGNEFFHGMSDEVLAADLAARSAEATLLGHSTPNGDFFQEIRMANSELYQKALQVTSATLETFPPEYWILQTDDAAKQYANTVNLEIQKVTV